MADQKATWRKDKTTSPEDGQKRVPFDASNEEHVRGRALSHKQQESVRIAGMQTCMGTIQGRAFIWWLLEKCHPMQISVPPFSAEAYFKEGERNIGNQLFAELKKHSRADFVRMEDEAETAKKVFPAMVPVTDADGNNDQGDANA